MVKVGDRVKRKVEYGMEGGSLLPAEEGTVVYVHPENRFYTVEFTFPGKHGRVQKIRESYLIQGEAPVKEPGYGPRLAGEDHHKG